MIFTRGEFALGLFFGAALVLLGYLLGSPLGSGAGNWDGRLSIIASVCAAVAAIASLIVAVVIYRREQRRDLVRGKRYCLEQALQISEEIDSLTEMMLSYTSYDIVCALRGVSLRSGAEEAIQALRVEREKLDQLSFRVNTSANDVALEDDLVQVDRLPLLMLIYRNDLRAIRLAVENLIVRVK